MYLNFFFPSTQALAIDALQYCDMYRGLGALQSMCFFECLHEDCGRPASDMNSKLSGPLNLASLNVRFRLVIGSSKILLIFIVLEMHLVGFVY